MKYYCACVIVSFLINFCNCEIKFIQAVIRHGDRNPIGGELVDFFWPNDQYKNSDWAPDGPMELTNTGKMNAYKLGKFFRERYGDLFGEIYKSNIVFFEAVRLTRSMNTAQLIAAGIFSSNSETQMKEIQKGFHRKLSVTFSFQDIWGRIIAYMCEEIQQKYFTHVNHVYIDCRWNPKLAWTPVPIHSTAISEDRVFVPVTICQNYQIDRVNSEADVMRILSMLSDVTEFFNYLSVHTGVNHTSVLQSYALYHQLASQTALGITLEPWTMGIFPDGKLKDMVGIEYGLSTYTKRMKRLLGGVWIKKFLNHTDLLQNNGKLQSGFFHAANELQVGAILNTLGVYKSHMPGYSSAIIFELHEINGEYYVKMLYRNEEKLSELVIPGCESLCPLLKFRDILKDVTLENFEEDCGEKPNSILPSYAETLSGK